MMFIQESDQPLIGTARLLRIAHAGGDLAPFGTQLIAQAEAEGSGHALMDLSTVLQLLGKRELAMSAQAQAIALQQLYALPTVTGGANIRLLAIMGAGDLMSNTPVELLLEQSDIALTMLYVTEQFPLPDFADLPAHDVLFVAVGQSDHNERLLTALAAALSNWPRPVLNKPARIAGTSRHAACALLKAVPSVVMPVTIRISRDALESIAAGTTQLDSVLEGGYFPIIIRPVDSHAGQNLEKIEQVRALQSYLQNTTHQSFYIAGFVDYRSQDGFFRKYRIVLIAGKPFICHLAISEHWMIHYLNAGMAESAEKRAEEAQFMLEFDLHFAVRHAAALQAIGERVGMDYLGIDCGESADGRLLIFEIDGCMVVHAMDPEDVFPYKQPQMRKVFSAFRQMLFNTMRL